MFNFWQIGKKVIAYIAPGYDTLYVVWLKSDETVEGVLLQQFS